MKAPVAEIIRKMTEDELATLHDTDHFLKVYGWARTIGLLEQVPEETQDVLEVAAVLHDIACPCCRMKYGHAAGALEEEEGMPMMREILAPFSLPEDFVERVVWLVGHHHTVSNVETLEHRILLEADFLVNADEGKASRQTIEEMERQVFSTASGKRMLTSMYLLK